MPFDLIVSGEEPATAAALHSPCNAPSRLLGINIYAQSSSKRLTPCGHNPCHACCRLLVALMHMGHHHLPLLGPGAQTGKFVPEKSNIWRDCCDGMYDWVKEHIEEVRWLTAPSTHACSAQSTALQRCTACGLPAAGRQCARPAIGLRWPLASALGLHMAPLYASSVMPLPPLLLLPPGLHPQ